MYLLTTSSCCFCRHSWLITGIFRSNRVGRLRISHFGDSEEWCLTFFNSESTLGTSPIRSMLMNLLVRLCYGETFKTKVIFLSMLCYIIRYNTKVDANIRSVRILARFLVGGNNGGADLSINCESKRETWCEVVLGLCSGVYTPNTVWTAKFISDRGRLVRIDIR